MHTLKTVYLTTLHIMLVASIALIIAFHHGLEYSMPVQTQKVAQIETKQKMIQDIFSPAYK